MSSSLQLDAPVFSLRHKLIQPARRTEGKLALLLAALVALGIAAGLISALNISSRAGQLDEVTGHGGPLTAAALEVYQSLSDADATSASAFLAGGAEPAELRDRYRDNIARSAAALTTASASSSATAVAELSHYLPVYTGLVESARTYNRQALPLGAAYLREASALVQDRMLPAAKRLYEDEAKRLATSQDEARTTPLAALVMGALLVGGLVAGQVYLKRRTRRTFNLGLVVATAAALGAMGWLAVASASAATGGEAARQEGSARIEALAKARIAGLQARTDEAMTLVARGNGSAFEQHFTTTMNELTGAGGLLAGADAAASGPETRAAIGLARNWLSVHQELRKLDDAGKYPEAVGKATGTAPDSAESLARGFDNQLGKAMEQASRRLDSAARGARDALSGTDIGAVVLLALAVFGAGAGIWPRIAEYR